MTTRRVDHRSALVTAALATALVGMLLLSSMLWSRHRETIDPAVLVVSRDEAANFFTLDYRHPDADIAHILQLATGKFRRQYAAETDAIRAGIRTKKLIVTASVPVDGAAVEFQRDARAQTIVAVDVTTRSATGSRKSDRYRARLVLVRQHGTWLVSDLKQVG